MYVIVHNWWFDDIGDDDDDSFPLVISYTNIPHRVADVGGPRDRRSPKGQGLLRKKGPTTYAILSLNLVLSRFTRFMNGYHRAFYESHPSLGVFSTKVSLLLKGFQQKSALFGELLESSLSKSFHRAWFWRAFREPLKSPLSESFQRAFVEPAFRELLESLLSKSFQRAFGEPAFVELS